MFDVPHKKAVRLNYNIYWVYNFCLPFVFTFFMQKNIPAFLKYVRVTQGYALAHEKFQIINILFFK